MGNSDVLRIVEPAVGQRDLGGGALAPARTGGIGSLGLRVGPGREDLAQGVERGDLGELGPHLAAHGEASHVPADVLADIARGVVFAVVLCQELGMADDNAGDLAECGLVRDGLAAQLGGKLREEPGAAQAAAADLHAVAARSIHHALCVVSAEDIAVAEDGDLVAQVFLEARDLVPTSVAGIALRGRASVEGDGCCAIVDGNPAGVEVCVVLIVDAHAHLHRDRYVRAFGGLHGRGDDIAKELALIGQS